MCYKKPGPRCSAHASALLRAAKEAYEESKTQDNYNVLREASHQFNMTPRGQDGLRQKIYNSTAEEKIILQEELAHGIKARRLALDRIATDDCGDIMTNEEVAYRDSRINPTELEHLIIPGMIFEHSTYLDKNNEPIIFRITAIRRGSVYYRGLDGKGSFRIDRSKFHSSVRKVIT